MSRPMPGFTRSPFLVALLLLAACDGSEADTPDASTDVAQTGVGFECDPGNAGLELADGFCALLYAEVGPARHLTVRENGDVFVALRGNRDGTGGGVVALRDSDGDGRADVEERFGADGATGILLDGEDLYFAPNDRVERHRLPLGALTPEGEPEIVVGSLPASRNHAAKSIALVDGMLYVNVGGPSNACQTESRQAGSPGLDPCPELETRGGIWRFDASRTDQVQTDGSMFATGLRNVVALASHPLTGSVFGVVHGRDSLHELWPDYYTQEDRVEKPSEEFVLIDEGDDFGWPYCYHDPEDGVKYLAPEYSGDGVEIGRCAEMEDPIIGFPAHWAPNALAFYTGSHFPAEYHGGAFIAFHGSWNRAPEPQAGYRVVFVPMDGDRVTGEWSTFANGFAGDDPSPRGPHRPTGVAQGPDGTLYVSDSVTGKIWRIAWAGARE